MTGPDNERMDRSSPSLASGESKDSRLAHTLRSIDYPATTDDLLRIAVADHLEVRLIDAIHELPRVDYHGATEVLRALSAEQAELPPDDKPGAPSDR